MGTTSYTFIKGAQPEHLLSEVRRAYGVTELSKRDQKMEWLFSPSETIIIGLNTASWGVISIDEPKKHLNFFKYLSEVFKTDVYVAYYQSASGECFLYLYSSGEIQIKLEQNYDDETGEVLQGEYYFRNTSEIDLIANYFEASHCRGSIWFDYYEIQDYLISKGVVYDAFATNEYLHCKAGPA